MMKPFTSTAPGRLCLFGEHQGYLGLPVIAFALPLPLTCRIRVIPNNNAETDTETEADTPGRRVLTLRVPALNRRFEYDLDDLPPPQGQGPAAGPGAEEEPDFALAAIHEVVVKEGWHIPRGADCVSTNASEEKEEENEIPMRAGCSSSSAFVVAWIQALAVLAGREPLSPLELAKRAHRAEVVHFAGPGGTMDHVASAVGGLLRIGPSQWQFEHLPSLPSSQLGVWVLAYSGEPKETIRHLTRCKTARLALLAKLGGDWDSSSRGMNLDATETALLEATRTNRDTESKAAELWEKGRSEEDQGGDSLGRRLGELMMRHHEALRDGLQLSTPRLEAMNAAAAGAGAWGFKVVGSGGGGCAVAWTPVRKAREVELAMRRAGAPLAWIIEEPGVGAFVQRSDAD